MVKPYVSLNILKTKSILLSSDGGVKQILILLLQHFSTVPNAPSHGQFYYPEHVPLSVRAKCWGPNPVSATWKV